MPPPRRGRALRVALPVRDPGGQSCNGGGGGGGRYAGMAGAGSEARFAGLSLMQLNELLEDEGQLTEMVQKMEEVSRDGA